MRTLATVVAFGLAAGSCWAGQNLFVNPSFELGNFTPNGDNTVVLGSGSAAIAGWRVVNSDVAWIGTPNPFNGLAPSEGSRFLDLTSYNGVQGGVEQTIVTEPGVLYRITFDQGSGVYGNSYVRASASDAQGTIQSVDFTEIGTASVRWDQHSFDFVARDAQTTVTFGHFFGGGNYTGLDNVVGVAVSETCIGDYDQDGGITAGDISAFFVDFEAGSEAADLDLDGGITPADVAVFFEHYESGC